MELLQPGMFWDWGSVKEGQSTWPLGVYSPWGGSRGKGNETTSKQKMKLPSRRAFLSWSVWSCSQVLSANCLPPVICLEVRFSSSSHKRSSAWILASETRGWLPVTTTCSPTPLHGTSLPFCPSPPPWPPPVLSVLEFFLISPAFSALTMALIISATLAMGSPEHRLSHYNHINTLILTALLSFGLYWPSKAEIHRAKLSASLYTLATGQFSCHCLLSTGVTAMHDHA